MLAKYNALDLSQFHIFRAVCLVRVKMFSGYHFKLGSLSIVLFVNKA